MQRRYIATYEYTEIVKGKERDFVHETIIEATGPALAYGQAMSHFAALARESGVGWLRVLTSCSVAEAPRGAVAKGGRRVQRDGELDT